MDLNLSDNVALCTAASSGLGLACAKSLAHSDANVAICGRTKSRLESAADQLEVAGTGEVLTVQADLTEPKDITALVDETVNTFGGIDHVVMSSGDPAGGPFFSIEDQDWFDAYDLLVMSVVWTLQDSFPYLRDSSAGSAVAITSQSVREVMDGLILSNAVRRAVIGLVQGLSKEFAPDIRVNALLPGVHETRPIVELIEKAVESGTVANYQEGAENWATDIPLDRMGEPKEFGDFAAFLLSQKASHIHGALIPVDGGTLRS